MRKTLALVFIFCFLFVSLIFGSNKGVFFKDAPIKSKSSYEIILYHVGDIYSSDQVFSVSYRGTYIGCSDSFYTIRVNQPNAQFKLRDIDELGQNVMIGNFSVELDGRPVVYEVMANLR